jgi:hypothetical protein
VPLWYTQDYQVCDDAWQHWYGLPGDLELVSECCCFLHWSWSKGLQLHCQWNSPPAQTKSDPEALTPLGHSTTDTAASLHMTLPHAGRSPYSAQTIPALDASELGSTALSLHNVGSSPSVLSLQTVRENRHQSCGLPVVVNCNAHCNNYQHD